MNNVHKVTKNAIALYLRAAFNLIIQLVAVRYLLKYLGEESYGLYGLIGSVVLIAESLRGVFANSIQRFLNIESANDDITKLRDVFNVGLHIILIIAVLAIIIILAGGMMAIPYLNIPPNLHHAARIVLICSTLTLGFNFIITAYDAVIIANEKFNYLAYLSISQSILRLASVLILVYYPTGRVERYSLFILIVSFIICIACRQFCQKYYKDVVTIASVSDKTLYKKIGSYAIYKAVGSTFTSIQTAGINVLLNIFGNLVVNTARTISYQVISAVNILVWNLVTSFSPRCISLYGQGNYDEFNKMLYLMMKSTLAINVTLGFVISVFICPILKLWLGEIPPYTPWFIRIIFLYYIVKALQDGFDLLFSAVGKIKEFQYTLSITQAGSIIIGWCALWGGCPYYSVFIIMVVLECVSILIALYYSKKLCDFDISYFCRTILLPLTILLAILCTVFACSSSYLSEISDLFLFILLGLAYFVLAVLLSLYFLFGRHAIKSIFRKAIAYFHIKI